jgi:hypothetical protein
MKKRKRLKSNHHKPNREQARRTKELEQRDSLKFYKTMCAALVRRAGGRMTIQKEEFDDMKGMLQWRKTDHGGVEFLFVGAEGEGAEEPQDQGAEL